MVCLLLTSTFVSHFQCRVHLDLSGRSLAFEEGGTSGILWRAWIRLLESRQLL